MFKFQFKCTVKRLETRLGLSSIADLSIYFRNFRRSIWMFISRNNVKYIQKIF